MGGILIHIFFSLLISLLFSIGIYLLLQKNLIKSLFGINLISHSLNILTVCSTLRVGYKTPILSLPIKNISTSMFINSQHYYLLLPYISNISFLKYYVDPLTQALVLTSIVISLATTSIFLILIYYINNIFKTTNILNLRKLRG